MTDEPIRTVRFSPYLKGQGPTFTLTLWDDCRTDPMGKLMVRYRLNMRTGDRASGTDKSTTLFEGADFACSPMNAIDSDRAVEDLMGFLTVRPGDVEEEYFEDYSPAQVDYCGQHCEALAMEVMDRFGPPE